jgi:hypothetical protein
MSFTNSAIKGVAITLPSVEAGLGTMNILRDPPKSIQTKFKPKVTDTSRITNMVDASQDRICESIKRYARGINPMVSVSYSNNGTNGGQMTDRSGSRSGSQSSISTGEAYYAHRVMREGAFRPPVRAPRDLLPLSRLPRVNTSTRVNAGSNFTANVAKLKNCSTDMKQIRNELLKAVAEPKAIFNICNPVCKPYEVDNMVKDDKLQANAYVNKSDKNKYVLGVNKTPDRGVKKNCDVLHGQVISNASKPVNMSASDFHGNQKIPVQNTLKGSYGGRVIGNDLTSYIHNDIQLERNGPRTSVHANPTRNIDLNSNINSREYRNLPDRLSRGGFQNQGCVSNSTRMDQSVKLNEKSIYQQGLESAMSRRR